LHSVIIMDSASKTSSSNDNDKSLPNWKMPDFTLTGYTGNKMTKKKDDHVLETNYQRRMIRGYSGFMPNGKTISGKPIIPSDDTQRVLNEISLGTHMEEDLYEMKNEEVQDDFSSSREYAKHMDLLERYADATRQLLERGQSPEMLIKLLQGKISEKVTSYAEQLITLKLEFQPHGGIERLDFRGLRECLERMNIQLDDVQCLALFSFFDVEGNG
jgi:hypothetical protein